MSDDRVLFPFKGMVEKVTTRRGDKSLVITMATQELGPKDKANLFELHEQYVEGVFALGYITQDEVVDNLPEKQSQQIEAPKNEGSKPYKSKSQELRHRLKILYKHKNGTEEGFEEYYEHCIDGLIARVNNQIKDFTHEE